MSRHNGSVSELPSTEDMIATSEIYKAAIPALEEVLSRLATYQRRLLAIEDACSQVFEGDCGVEETPESITVMLRHKGRVSYLQLFGLFEIMKSIGDDLEPIADYLREMLEIVESDGAGYPEWAE